MPGKGLSWLKVCQARAHSMKQKLSMGRDIAGQMLTWQLGMKHDQNTVGVGRRGSAERSNWITLCTVYVVWSSYSAWSQHRPLLVHLLIRLTRDVEHWLLIKCWCVKTGPQTSIKNSWIVSKEECYLLSEQIQSPKPVPFLTRSRVLRLSSTQWALPLAGAELW